MGGSHTKETVEYKAANHNGKNIELLAEMCASWGYGSTKSQVVSQLIKNLTDLGYNINCTFEPLNGGNGEFYVYHVKDSEKNIVYSNNKKLHESKNAVIGGKINSSNVKQIVDKIVA